MADDANIDDEARPGDLALVRAALTGDSTAWEQFATRMQCLPRIVEALNARLGRALDDHDLADLSQEVLVIVWRKLDTFTGTSQLETWIYGVARLELMNAVRRKRRSARTSTEVDPDAVAEDVDEPFANALDYVHLHDGLAMLDRDERDVVRLKHFDDQTFEEIGRTLGIPGNTAKTRYYRGIARLYEVLRVRLGEGERS